MPAYSSDKEQIEELKQLWKEYGRWIVVAVLIGLLFSYGWRYWQTRTVTANLAASDQYQNVLNAAMHDDWAQVDAQRLVLAQNHPSSCYATYAYFIAAKHAVDTKQYDVALADLTWIEKNSQENIYQQIAMLRSARILIAQNHLDLASQLLAKPVNKNFVPAVFALEGDIARLQNNPSLATNYYQKAFVGYADLGIEDPLLAMNN